MSKRLPTVVMFCPQFSTVGSRQRRAVFAFRINLPRKMGVGIPVAH